MSEGLSQGLPTKEILENAIRDADRKTEPFEEPSEAELNAVSDFFLESLSEEESEFLEPNEFDRARAEKSFEDSPSQGSLLARAMLEKLFKIGEPLHQKGEHPDLLRWMEQAGSHLTEIVGGLTQADCMMGETFRDETREDVQRKNAIAIVQLKRALKAHSFVRGAIFAMYDHVAIDHGVVKSFHDSLDGILENIHQQMATAWGCDDE